MKATLFWSTVPIWIALGFTSAVARGIDEMCEDALGLMESFKEWCFD